MALATRLQLRQSQSLVMTPQLLQSIRLLQFTHAELERFIDEEIERNPLIERAEPEQVEAFDDDRGPSPEMADGTADWFQEDLRADSGAISASFDTSLENIFPDDPGRHEQVGPELQANWKSSPPSSGGGEGLDVENLARRTPSLRDHVGEQIAFAFHDPATRLIADELADCLDEAGYFRGDPSEIAARLGSPPGRTEAVLALCQRFEPPGLFARDLAECIALQLAARDRLDPAMKALVGNLDLLARRDFATLKRLCGVDEDDLLDMMAEIRSLDPKPGAAFESSGSEPIVPDVVVQPAPDGSWAVELNPATLPRLLVDNSYFARVSADRSVTATDREFLSECMQSASWLARSLDQRARTILKVAGEIVRQQDGFLAHGIRHLRPLNLRTVADAISMHESTVSRVTANKYMLTPRGVFEMRFFFTAALAAVAGGESHSSESVRDRIRELIAGERADDVLSDDAIVDTLKEEGIDIARRTVAKYREGMNIPSSVRRRREKRALAAAGR